MAIILKAKWILIKCIYITWSISLIFTLFLKFMKLAIHILISRLLEILFKLSLWMRLILYSSS